MVMGFWGQTRGWPMELCAGNTSFTTCGLYGGGFPGRLVPTAAPIIKEGGEGMVGGR